MNSSQADGLTRMRELERGICLLANLESCEKPVLSCYLDLRDSDHREFVTARHAALREASSARQRRALDEAFAIIEARLERLEPGARGIALFARAGNKPLDLALQFAVPVSHYFAACATPDVYPLMQLKDDYARYLIVRVRADWTQIVEVNLGAVSVRASAANPRAPRRVARPPWARRAAHTELVPTDQRVRLGERLAERLLRTGRHAHLILAGEPALTAQMREQLPAALQARLVDILPIADDVDQDTLVAESLRAFIAYEERHSQAVAARVVRGVRAHGLAVAGAAASLEALREGIADTLVISSHYEAPNENASPVIDTPPVSRATHALRHSSCTRDWRSQLVRAAGRRGVAVEVVESSDELEYLGGVGCLLHPRRDSMRAPFAQTTSGARVA